MVINKKKSLFEMRLAEIEAKFSQLDNRAHKALAEFVIQTALTAFQADETQKISESHPQNSDDPLDKDFFMDVDHPPQGFAVHDAPRKLSNCVVRIGDDVEVEAQRFERSGQKKKMRKTSCCYLRG